MHTILQNLTPVIQSAGDMLRAMFPEQRIVLAPAPWARSFNFSVVQPWLDAMTNLEGMLEAAFEGQGLRLRPRREFHISWA